jgi:hypothetical protein
MPAKKLHCRGTAPSVFGATRYNVDRFTPGDSTQSCRWFLIGSKDSISLRVLRRYSPPKNKSLAVESRAAMPLLMRGTRRANAPTIGCRIIFFMNPDVAIVIAVDATAIA